MGWALIWTAPGAESRACAHLTQQSIEHYAFRLRERGVVDGRIVWRDKWMFPRYIFARSEALHALAETRGVVDLVRVGCVPASVPDGVVDELLCRRDADGMISIGPTQWISRYRPGQPVRVSQGPLIGYDGIFDVAHDEGRVRVLLEMMGMQTPVVLSESDLSDAPIRAVEDNKKYRPRRSRRVPISVAA